MKATKLIKTMLVCVMLSSFQAVAQNQMPPFPGGRPEGMPPREILTAKQRAEKRTQEMHSAVQLDEKQYKKIYKIFLKEENAKDAAMEFDFPMGPPPGGFGGGMPLQGGFPAGPPPGMGGFPGGPPSGMPFPGGFGEPQKPKVGGKEIDSDEYIDAREENFKKILTPEQYQTWRKLHPDPSGFFVK